MKARMVVARLPTRARHSSKRGMPTAMPQETITSSVRMTQSMA